MTPDRASREETEAKAYHKGGCRGDERKVSHHHSNVSRLSSPAALTDSTANGAYADRRPVERLVRPRFTTLRSSSLICVWNPGPRARKKAMTSASRRIVVDTFLGAC